MKYHGHNISRTGRPKADNPKAISHTIRLDAETERKFQLYCKEHNISKGEAIRQGIHLLIGNKK
ncbi:MAG: CopG family transcriptional regulator [Ruminococcus sp.]|nr:CopG family transcriptional regulator [Ruminococcus sp.]